MATTVRVRDGESQFTDGPFAITNEILAGDYILRCDDLDQALKAAERLPLARYGSIEVRPILDVSSLPASDGVASEQGCARAFSRPPRQTRSRTPSATSAPRSWPR